MLKLSAQSEPHSVARDVELRASLSEPHFLSRLVAQTVGVPRGDGQFARAGAVLVSPGGHDVAFSVCARRVQTEISLGRCLSAATRCVLCVQVTLPLPVIGVCRPGRLLSAATRCQGSCVKFNI